VTTTTTTTTTTILGMHPILTSEKYDGGNEARTKIRHYFNILTIIH
jgi:hypothetical protein